MVKTYAQLYLDARRSLLATEDAQTAGFLARNILSHCSGKSQEAILCDRDKYASEEICQAIEAATARLMAGEPLAYVLGIRNPRLVPRALFMPFLIWQKFYRSVLLQRLISGKRV